LNSTLELVAKVNINAGASVSLFRHATGGTRAVAPLKFRT
jgi:hypothetical protein